jgi:hypothetical protein
MNSLMHFAAIVSAQWRAVLKQWRAVSYYKNLKFVYSIIYLFKLSLHVASTPISSIFAAN